MQKRVDHLGRVVLPAKLRKELGFEENQLVNITAVGGKLVLTKAVPTCNLCGATEYLLRKGGFLLCEDCLRRLEKL